MESINESQNEKKQKVNNLMKQVNEIIHSVFTMQLIQIDNQITLCSKIVGQLLHNDLIFHIKSLPSLKLLLYELILKLAESVNNTNFTHSNYINSKVQQNVQYHNMTACKVLHSVKDLLQQIAWTYPQKMKYKTEKIIKESKQPSIKIAYYQKQLNILIQEYQNSIQSKHRNKYRQQQSDYDQQGHNILIQQLQNVLSKKQQRIKQLTCQLQQSLSQQRQMQQMIEQQQIQKQQTQKKIEMLKYQINRLQQNNKFNINDNSQLRKNLLERSNDCQEKDSLYKDLLANDNIDCQNLQRLLLIQALSIQSILQ